MDKADDELIDKPESSEQPDQMDDQPNDDDEVDNKSNDDEMPMDESKDDDSIDQKEEDISNVETPIGRRSSRSTKYQSEKKPKPQPKSDTSIKRGEKRKSSPLDTPAKSKLPKFEVQPVSLTTKTIYIKNNVEHYYALDRPTLTTIPTKEGSYGVGDLIWAKMTGYPWWPCIISIDPETGNYCRISGSSCKADRVYHVQYFGPEAYRGWTAIGMVMPFEGIEKFYEKINEEISDLPKKKVSKVLEKCNVKPSIKKKWNESVSEAELALKLDRKERVNKLTFNYVVGSEAAATAAARSRKSQLDSIMQSTPSSTSGLQSSSSVTSKTPKEKKGTAKKRSASGKKGKAMNQSSEDVYDFDEDSEKLDNEPFPSLCFASRRPKGDFDVYCREHLDEETEAHPEMNKSEVIELLKQRWDELSEEMRSVFIERKAIYEDDSNMFVAKRSTFDDDYLNDSDSDYNDSDGNDNFKEEEDDSPSVMNNSTPKKNAKAQKSEKLFDKIKNENNDTPTTAKTPTRSGRRRTATKVSNSSVTKKSIKPSKSELKSSDQKSNSTASMKNVESTPSSKANVSDPLSNPPDMWVKKLCSLDESADETSGSDAASVNDEIGSSKKVEEDRFCYKCGDEELTQSNILVKCSGICRRMFHQKCIGDEFNDDPDNYYCLECETNEHKCFACNNPDDLETKKCESTNCGKFYHLSCIEKFYPVQVNETANSFICPLHTCLTCHLETLNDNQYRANKKKLVKCIYCPTAYHTKSICMAAGTAYVSKNYVICPEHYKIHQNLGIRHDRHINVNHCFSCLSGGNLICCESCPAAFHESCLEYTFDHDKSFYCGGCTSRKQLRYGDIIWAKLGIYRWWPGKICHPNIVPENVMKLSHNVGEFPVYFFGSKDYSWVNKGRAYLFVEGDKQASNNHANKTGGSKPLTNKYKLALKEASAGFEEWCNNRKEIASKTIATKPAPYQHINSNRYLNKQNSNGNSTEDHSHICDCKETSDCSDDSCLNRISFFECDPKQCPTGDRCKNQRFRKCEYVKCKPFITTSAGWGLMTLEDIKKGQFVIEYCGEVIDEKECDKRLKKIASTQSNFYFLNFEKDLYIDAGPKGNLARFMNHSCEPNCVTQKWVVNNLTRVGLFALHDIPSGTELTFNYNLDCRGNEKVKCECGSSKCSGFIGGKKEGDDGETKTKSKLMNGTSSKTNGNNHKRNSKRKLSTNGGNASLSKFKQMHDDLCFKCGEAGKLVMCDDPTCPKSYHLACVQLSHVPKDDWICPRHRCMIVDCTENVITHCTVCPNSVCKLHVSQSNNQLPDDQYLCDDHRMDDLTESELANGATLEENQNESTKKQNETEKGQNDELLND